jgi:hypothetical protein
VHEKQIVDVVRVHFRPLFHAQKIAKKPLFVYETKKRLSRKVYEIMQIKKASPCAKGRLF